MINTDDLCMSCMKEIGNVTQCPHCGFHSDSTQIAPYLPIRAVVANRYLIGKLLEYNGEGAAYMCWDLTNKVAVTIREFLPTSIASRAGASLTISVIAGGETIFHECCQSFLDMWRQLARLRGLSALVNVVDIVEDFGTAYAVSEYFEGVSLRDFLLKSKTGYIAWDKARELFMPVLSTLGTLHTSGIIHRGISPTTLLIGKDGKVRISGFSIWQARTVMGGLAPQLFDGYSAIEQYGQKGQQGPWTDIYAFSGVLYRSLIGSDPIDAPSRMANDKLMIPAKFAEQIPAYVVNALINSLQILPDDRTRSVEQLRAELSASPVAAAAGGNLPQPQKPLEPSELPAAVKTQGKLSKKEKSAAIKAAVISFAAGLLVFLILAATVWKDDFFGNNITETAASTTAAVSEQWEVPDFAKLGTWPVISTNAVWSERFTLVPEEVFNSQFGTGVIISQSVAPGTVVDKGTNIVFQISKGKEMIILPDTVIGMDYAAAEATLKELGFVCQRRDETNDGTKTANQVLAVSPSVNQKYEKGSTVVLRVWAEPASTTLPGGTTTH